jgi:glycosyltransferase involved in cell wall biosynthesis
MSPVTGKESIELRGEDIVCFANDWNSDPLSKKHIMLRLARHNRILWVNSIGTRNPRPSVRDLRRAFSKARDFLRGSEPVQENITVFSPLAIPFHGNPVARRLNRAWLSWSLRRIMRRLKFRRPILWTFLPNTADMVGTLGEQLVIYHCVDEFSEFTGANKAALLEEEERLIRAADAVVVSSGQLYESKRRHNPNTFLVTHGVEVEHFRKACNTVTEIPAALRNLPQPVIGFFGLVADWIDLDLIRALALARPQWSFVLLGKLDTAVDQVRGLPNVHLLGATAYSQLPSYCKGFNVALLPFRVNELTIAANPLKLREYLAAGLPVVASPIPEARRLEPFVAIAQTTGEFIAAIETALARGSGARLESSLAMDAESWDEKVLDLCRIVAYARQGRAHSDSVRSAVNIGAERVKASP